MVKLVVNESGGLHNFQRKIQIWLRRLSAFDTNSQIKLSDTV